MLLSDEHCRDGKRLLSRVVRIGLPLQMQCINAVPAPSEETTGVYWKPVWRILSDGSTRMRKGAP